MTVEFFELGNEMTTTKKMLRWLFVGCLTVSVSWSQEQNLQTPAQEKKPFREAGTDSVQEAFKNDLFESYVLLGVLMVKLNAPYAEIASAFEEAIKLYPNKKPDEKILPPESAEIFYRTRDRLVGCIFVASKPGGAEMRCVQADSAVFIATTPTLFCDLAAKPQIVIAKEGFEEYLTTVQLSPGRVDTLFVELKPSISPKTPTSTARKKSKGVLWWSLVTAGAALAITSSVLYQTVFDDDKKKNGIEELEDLPKPPDRP
jgi:hypothetical protein